MSDTDPLPPSLFGQWVHSHEEDHDGIEVYRPAGYAFPPSRGRRGFKLHQDGRAAYNGIGAVDRPETIEGRWARQDDGRIRLDLDGRVSLVSFEVISVDGEQLEVRRG